jgi:hypothetical protein
MKEIRVALPCECGGSVIAQAGDAGSSIVCRCGRMVRAPRLSELRTLAGQDAFVTNPVEAIRKIQREGHSPAGKSCLVCGGKSPVQYRCDATCESSHLKGGQSDAPGVLGWLTFFCMAFFLGIGFLFRRGGQSEGVVHGHDVGVTFDLPVCDACAATNGKPTRTAVAKNLMLQVPAYRDLLARYPDLKLSVRRMAA